MSAALAPANPPASTRISIGCDSETVISSAACTVVIPSSEANPVKTVITALELKSNCQQKQIRLKGTIRCPRALEITGPISKNLQPALLKGES